LQGTQTTPEIEKNKQEKTITYIEIIDREEQEEQEEKGCL
jgi:hypothetical protein